MNDTGTDISECNTYNGNDNDDTIVPINSVMAIRQMR